MKGMPPVSRRQFNVGAGAVLSMTTLPFISRMTVPLPAMETLAARDPHLARMVRGLARRARLFRHLNDRYFADERYSARWTAHYGPMVRKADVIYARIGRPQTQEERDVVSWLESIVESETTMARTPWHRIPNLSNRGRWLEAMLEEAMIRRAEARLAYSWISRHGWCNPCNPGHAAILKAYRDTELALRVAFHRIRTTLRPCTQADLQLLQRAWQCRLYRPRCFEVKYYPKVRARHAIFGIVADRSTSHADMPGRMFRYVVPEDSPGDGPRTTAARASARRVNLQVSADIVG